MLPIAAYQLERPNQVPQIVPPNDDVRERISHEYTEIRDELRRHHLADNLYNDIARWCNTFERAFLIGAIRDNDLRQAIQHALEAMQRIFRCSLPPHGLLDRTALLGSDGHVYSPGALQLFRDQTPEPYRNRSPFDLNNSAPFTTVPHPLANCISRWLAGYGVFASAPVPPPLLVQPPPLLLPVNNNPLPPPLQQLPVINNHAHIQEFEGEDDDEEVLAEEVERQLLEGRAQREHQHAQREPELREFQREIMAGAVPILERYQADMRRNAAEHHANLDVLEQRVEGLIGRVYPAINELRQANHALAQDNEARGRRVEELRGRLERENVHMDAIEREAAQLRTEVNQLHESINQREQQRNDSLIKSIIIIITCIAVAKILPPLVGALGGVGGGGTAAAAAAGAGAGTAGVGAVAGAGAGAAGAGVGAAAGAGAATTTIVPGLNVGIAPVNGGGKLVLNVIW